ncbi:DUF92 domain-containing protein [Gorillibacterium massiliense]|uniref:DUF92 domain-containing protein n=1 Tax=Gorillibacterium massiliense TaxID=1280390 RepID=UPI0004BC60CD|nr:DUF92 domain-containing protein [Gorillibacterium massiliense]
MAALAAAALIGGIGGAFADSFLGATLQRMYRCSRCGRLLERPQHCGLPADFARGLPWMNNDVVNVVSSLLGGAAAILVYALLT